jgi:hypothetical protein
MVNVASILLLRSMNTVQKDTDDKINIERIGEYIRVKYTDTHSNIVQRLYVSQEDFPRYIASLGVFYLKDTEPYKSIQFNFPGFPTILLNNETMSSKKTQDALLDAAEMVATSWFTEEEDE